MLSSERKTPTFNFERLFTPTAAESTAPALVRQPQDHNGMKIRKGVAFLIYSLCCLSLLTGCDSIFKRQIIIDFQNNRPNSFTVSNPGDVHNLFPGLGE